MSRLVTPSLAGHSDSPGKAGTSGLCTLEHAVVEVGPVVRPTLRVDIPSTLAVEAILV